MLIRFGLAVLAAFASLTAPSFAQDGQPGHWQYNFQTPATATALEGQDFHNLLFVIIAGIVALVTVLLIYVMLRFNERANPTPSKTTHNTLIEVIWTIVPVMILVVIALPSFRLVNNQLIAPEPDVVIKATGYQWYWGYEYVDTGLNGDAAAEADAPPAIEFISTLVPDSQLQQGQPRLLSVDNEVVVPVNRNILVQVTAADVIHAFAVPSFAVKVDAVPGRLNQTWFRAEREGVFYGQCSELCGRDHAFMPIAIRVVSDDEYRAWVGTKTASAPVGRAVAAIDVAR